MPGLAEKWDISPDGLTYTFTLRKGVKWHNHRAWKPTRDMNADDIIFMLERQGKEDNPYFKVTSSNHSYYNDMGMAKLIKSIQKVDDYTVRITLNKPEAPFLSNLAMEYAGVQSKEYADAMLKAGTPEKIDQEPIGTGPFYLVQYQKDAVIRYKAFPQFWGGKAKIDDLVFAITPDASVRWAKLQKGECHVMPYPNPADLDAIRKDPNVAGARAARPQRRLPRVQHDQEAVRRRARAQGDQHGDRQEGDHRRRVPRRPASRRRIRSRRRSGRTTTASRTTRSIPPRRRSSSPKRAIRTASRPTCGRCPCSVRTTPTRSASPSSCRPTWPRSASRPRSRASSGASTASACRRASTRPACSGWTGDNGDPDNFLANLLGLRFGQEQRQQRRQVLPPAVRGPDPEGEDGRRARPSARSSTSRRR